MPKKAKVKASTAEAFRNGFSKRLRDSLEGIGASDWGGTDLARAFNLEHPGPPVTVHAARKWMNGEAVPSRDKLPALAKLLGVSAEWLAHGSGDDMQTPPAMDATDIKALSLLRSMDDDLRMLALGILTLMAKGCV